MISGMIMRIIDIIGWIILLPFRIIGWTVALVGRAAGLVIGFLLMVVGVALLAGTLMIFGIPVFLIGLLLTMRAMG